MTPNLRAARLSPNQNWWSQVPNPEEDTEPTDQTQLAPAEPGTSTTQQQQEADSALAQADSSDAQLQQLPNAHPSSSSG